MKIHASAGTEVYKCPKKFLKTKDPEVMNRQAAEMGCSGLAGERPR